jgi:hypothetical protein
VQVRSSALRCLDSDFRVDPVRINLAQGELQATLQEKIKAGCPESKGAIGMLEGLALVASWWALLLSRPYHSSVESLLVVRVPNNS